MQYGGAGLAMKHNPNVLVIEDSEEDADLLLELRRGGFNPTYQRVDKPHSSAKAGGSALGRGSFDFHAPLYHAESARDGSERDPMCRLDRLRHHRRGRGGGDAGGGA
jgi:hypothetical protein